MEVNNIEIKPLVLEIVEEAVKKDLFFAIDCLQGYTFADDYFYQHPTQDLSLLCNQKPEDQYVGTDNLDVWCSFKESFRAVVPKFLR